MNLITMVPATAKFFEQMRAMLSRSSSPIGTVGRMQAVGNTRRRRTITFGITS